MASTTRTLTVELVKDETTKPSPTEYPSLLPTLQTWVGMVLSNGNPWHGNPDNAPAGQRMQEVRAKAAALRTRCTSMEKRSGSNSSKQTAIDTNFEACCLPVTKENLLDYISYGKRINIEQAVAMVIAYLQTLPTKTSSAEHQGTDDFEDQEASAVDQLLNDPGTVHMLRNTCMWREPEHLELLEDPQDLAIITKKNKILVLLGEDTVPGGPSIADFTPQLRDLRRHRKKLGNSQHLVLPPDLLPDYPPSDYPWNLSNHYKHGNQSGIPTVNPTVLCKNRFRRIQRLLTEMAPHPNPTSQYIHDVQRFIKSSGRLSKDRLAVLHTSNDPYAIAYSFLTMQRHRQLKVVSDQRWTRFLIKGEGALILQNRPDILTSFEDILVRHATDLFALTAVSCPKGLRDHFSTPHDIHKRTRKTCELMERYVSTFAPDGEMSKLVFNPSRPGGSGRGPVDFYNALCDELADCKRRAKAAGVDIRIGPVYKFLAKDILAWNNAWMDDAFANKKIPGWVQYLATVRSEDTKTKSEVKEIEMDEDEDEDWIMEDGEI